MVPVSIFVSVFLLAASALGSFAATSVNCGQVVQPANIPDTFFGMTLIDKNHWPDLTVGTLGKGTEVSWAYTEPSRGNYNWSNLDAWVKAAQAHGVGLMFSNDLIPAWAAADQSTCKPTYPGSSVVGCTSMVADVRDWDNFVTALVTRYKGRIAEYELWNEPDQFFTGTVADMVVLTQHMHTILRSLDPSATIVSSSSTAAEYMDRYWHAGGVKAVDAVSLHGYPHHQNPVPESIVEIARDYTSVMARHGLCGLPLWDTEGSWGDRTWGVIGANAQAAFLARHLLLHWSSGISRFYWYAWDNANWGTLWMPRKGDTPAGVAYREVRSWMRNATLTRPCSATTSVWTCNLWRPDSDALAVWSTSSGQSFVADRRFTTFRDLEGHSFAVTGSLKIGRKPILLEKTGRHP
jgi:Beta-galactosidase